MIEKIQIMLDEFNEAMYNQKLQGEPEVKLLTFSNETYVLVLDINHRLEMICQIDVHNDTLASIKIRDKFLCDYGLRADDKIVCSHVAVPLIIDSILCTCEIPDAFLRGENYENKLC